MDFTDMETATLEIVKVRGKNVRLAKRVDALEQTIKSIDQLIRPPATITNPDKQPRQRLQTNATCVSTTEAYRLAKDLQEKKEQEEAGKKQRREDAESKREAKKQAEEDRALLESTLVRLRLMANTDKRPSIGTLKRFLQLNRDIAEDIGIVLPDDEEAKKADYAAACVDVIKQANATEMEMTGLS
jgi:septum formation inhibitor MinC